MQKNHVLSIKQSIESRVNLKLFHIQKEKDKKRGVGVGVKRFGFKIFKGFFKEGVQRIVLGI